MATNNGNGSTPRPTPADNRAQYYVPYERTVTNVRQAATFAIADLVADGHSELSAPFARILEVLAGVDVAALKALDAAYAEGQK